MSGDVIERLRVDADEIEACGGGNEAATMREAASEIEALKHDIARYVEANTALMAERTSLIETKREQIERLTKQRDDAEDAENQAKDAFWAIYHDYLERGGSPVSTEAARTVLTTRAETAERQLAEARAALEPFATYMQDGGDKDNKGEPLPDTDGVGWVYLTIGDFRTAARTLTNGGENGR